MVDIELKKSREIRVQKKIDDRQPHKISSSQYSITKYLKNLAYLDSIGFDYKNVDDVEDLFNRITQIRLHNGADSFIGQHRCSEFLNCISYYYKKLESNDHNSYVIYYLGQLMVDLSIEYKLRNQKGIMSENMAKNYIEWDKVLKVYKLVEANKHINKVNFKKFLLLSLYVLMPVRRRTDYVYMYIVNSEKETHDKTKNYYVNVENGYFVFNHYKTCNTYGRQVIILVNSLDKIIKEYLVKYGIKDKLLDINEPDSLTNSLNSIFESYLEKKDDEKVKKIGVIILRHSFISYFEDHGKFKTLEARYVISKSMGHSILMELEYYKNPNKVWTQDEENKLMQGLKKTIVEGERLNPTYFL